LMNALAAAAGMSRPANLQNSYSLLDGDEDDLTNCVNLGVGFTAFSPLAGGWLTGKYRAGEPFPAGSRMTLRPEPYAALQSPDTFAAIDALAQHAIARGLDLATLALAWVLTDPRVSAAIVGPRTPAQLVQMLAALSVTLSPADRADLSAIARHRT
ncbi:MAG TPA: aldo/keto reductase, partial [Actinomycetes bacterium]|nr:aldo/keto reductase [Actinomycetes bacterium]